MAETSVSTETVEVDGKFYLIPTSVTDEDGNESIMPIEDAVSAFRAGKNSPIAEFDSLAEAQQFDAARTQPVTAPEGFVPVTQLDLVDFESDLTLDERFVSAEELDLMDMPDERSFGQKLVERFMGTDVDDPVPLSRAAATVAGSVVGAHVGAQVPRAPGPLGIVVNPVTGGIVFGMVGAIGGAAAPEAAAEMLEMAGVLPQGTREKSLLSSEELQTVIEGEALLEIATLGGITALRFTARGVGSLLTAPRQAGREAAEAAARQDIALIPVMVGDRAIGRGYVAVLGRFPFFATPIKEGVQQAEAQVQRRIMTSAERVGPISAWSTIGEDIFKDATVLFQKTNEMFGAAYEQVFKLADDLGVSVIPRASIAKADEVLAKINTTKTATVAGELTEASPALKIVEDFINTEILPLTAKTETGTVFAKQSLRQMDGLVSKIDEAIANLEPGQAKFARGLLIQLRQGAQLDSLANIIGEGADTVSQQLRALDQTFSHTMSELYETASAKKFARVRRKGIKGAVTDPVTTTPVDQLARLFNRLDSPQAVEELSRIVTPETMQRIAATTIDDAVSVASRNIDPSKTGMFDPEKFGKILGLDAPKSVRALSFKNMLITSKSPLSFDDFVEINNAARQVAKVGVPEVSTFIARRATLGGFRAAMTALIPSLAISSGVSFATGSVLGVLTFLFGARGISSAISNPTTARFLKEVLKEEATTVARRNAALQVIRFTAITMHETGQISNAEFVDAQRMTRQLMIEIDKHVKLVEGEDEE